MQVLTSNELESKANPPDGSVGLCSLTEMADRYGEGIRRTALRLTRSEAAAQDITQDVFLRVISKGGFDPSLGSFDRWVQMVTRSTAIDWIRREVAHRQRLTRVGALHSATIVGVEETVTARVQAAGVRASVGQLPEREREVVALAFFDGLTYRQIADQLGVPEGTVKSRIRRALTRLANTIARDLADH